MSKNTFITDYKNELESSFQTLRTKFVKQGYYVVITEMGACDKLNTENMLFQLEKLNCLIHQN